MISKASVLAISGFLILATMIIPNNYLSDTYDNYLHKTFGPLTLICHHEPLIIRSIDQHLHDVNAIDHRMLERVKNNMAVIVSQGPGPDHYSVLGYDPNLCLSGNVKNPIEEAYSHDPNRIAYLMTQIFLRAVRDDPLDYLAKVVRHMMAMLQQPLVEINVTTHFNDTSVPSATIIESVVGARLFADHSRFEGITRAPLTSDFGYAILNGINKTLWAMMLLGSILFILDIVWPGNGIKAVVLRWTPAMLASGLLICATLVVAISSTADVTRYRHPLCPLVLGTVVILLQVFVEMFRSNISCIGARQT